MDENIKFDSIELERLYRKVITTARCKHNASIRIKNHHQFSQWTLALISTVLIVSPLIEAAHDFDGSIAYAKYFGVIQVAFAVLVLVASLLVGALSFCLRAEKFHQCGVELDKLSFRISNKEETHKYYDLYARYNSILEKYENHKTIDHIEAKKAMKPRYYPDNKSNGVNIDHVHDNFKFIWHLFLEYLPYKIVPMLLILMAYATYSKHGS